MFISSDRKLEVFVVGVELNCNPKPELQKQI